MLSPDMCCEICDNGDRRLGRRPYVETSDGRVAVVIDVPVSECPACEEVWFAEEVALRLDRLLTGRLATELVAIRSYSEAAPSAT